MYGHNTTPQSSRILNNNDFCNWNLKSDTTEQINATAPVILISSSASSYIKIQKFESNWDYRGAFSRQTIAIGEKMLKVSEIIQTINISLFLSKIENVFW